MSRLQGTNISQVDGPVHRFLRQMCLLFFAAGWVWIFQRDGRMLSDCHFITWKNTPQTSPPPLRVLVAFWCVCAGVCVWVMIDSSVPVGSSTTESEPLERRRTPARKQPHTQAHNDVNVTFFKFYLYFFFLGGGLFIVLFIPTACIETTRASARRGQARIKATTAKHSNSTRLLLNI